MLWNNWPGLASLGLRRFICGWCMCITTLDHPHIRFANNRPARRVTKAQGECLKQHKPTHTTKIEPFFFKNDPHLSRLGGTPDRKGRHTSEPLPRGPAGVTDYDSPPVGPDSSVRLFIPHESKRSDHACYDRDKRFWPKQSCRRGPLTFTEKLPNIVATPVYKHNSVVTV